MVSFPLESPSEGRGADLWRLLRYYEAGALQVLHKPPGNYFGHDLLCVVDALAAMKAQGERQRVGEVGRVGGRQFVGVGHVARVAAERKRNKNEMAVRDLVPIDKPSGRPKSSANGKWRSMGAAEMPIKAYLPTSGAIFGPEAVATMGEAFEGAVAVLEIGERDEAQRQAVARFIIQLAEIDEGLNAATLRDKVVMALGASSPIDSKDGQSAGQKPR